MRHVLAFLLLFVALGILTDSAHAQLTVHPSYVQLNLDEGQNSGALTLSNTTDSEQRYRAQAVHWILSLEGSLRAVKPDKDSMAEWVKFNPKEFTLPANGTQVIRFSVLPPGNLEPGEYWAAIEFEPLEARESTGTDAAGRTMKIKIIASTLVSMFGRVGKIEEAAEIKDLSLTVGGDGVQIATTVVNTGDTRVNMKGEYEIVDEAGGLVKSGIAGESLILRGYERKFSVSCAGPLPAGDYTVRVHFKSAVLEEDLVGETALKLLQPLAEPKAEEES